jgi:AmmeMemoRadiSam system protein B
MQSTTRRPAVAGSFYPADPETLRIELESLTGGRRPAGGPVARALMVPHAGYIYSGRIAAQTFLASRLPERVVVLGPNHTGTGEAVAVMDRGTWTLPLGEAPIDAPLAGMILERCRAARADEVAHRREHSLEVQIPFLQVLAPGFRFVPICVGTQRLETLLDLGRALAEAIAAADDEVLLVLSSDMSHYLEASEAERLDRLAIDRVLAIDPEGLHRVVRERGISMCGVAPVVAGLEAARLLGATTARLVAHGHSGERSGDFGSVVGYAGVSVC